MGKRGRRGSGVELRENSIRVTFTWMGKRCRETLPPDFTPTPSNAKAAARMVREINDEIRAGTFEYRRYFPDSPHAEEEADHDGTFGAFCKLFLAKRSNLAPATLSQYANELERWKKRIGAAKPMRDIRHSWLAGQIGKVEFPSAEMRNNSLIPLRGAFDLWVRDDPRARSNPMEDIANAVRQKKKPDPLDREEVELMLVHMRKLFDPRISAYYEFAFFTGMRPEEQIALRWTKIDWRRKRALVDVVRTFKGGEKAVKTAKAREVDLNSRALSALRAMQRWTALKDNEEGHGHVFENPVTSRPWHDERSQRDHYWKPTLKKSRIRPRRAYQTRSTRATMMLMAQMNPAYCAAQLGHSKRIFWDLYADWIDQADKGRERAKDEAELARDPTAEERVG